MILRDIMLVHGNATKIPLPDNTVDCIVTSPPYYGLRKYEGTFAQAWEYTPEQERCEHSWNIAKLKGTTGGKSDKQVSNFGSFVDGSQYAICEKCGAFYGELGNEPTLNLYIQNMLLVGKELYRIMKPTATLWLNIGDTYVGSGGGPPGKTGFQCNNAGSTFDRGHLRHNVPDGMKAKDVMGVPWELAFAFRGMGFYLRCPIVWHKTSNMPSSVKDRPTVDYEFVFLMSKESRYFYDYYGSLEPANYDGRHDTIMKGSPKYAKAGSNDTYKAHGGERWPNQTVDGLRGRNMRAVWTTPTGCTSYSHTASFPPQLVEKCITAGTSEYGVCSECGKPYERVIEKPQVPDELYTGSKKPGMRGMGQKVDDFLKSNPPVQNGWRATCDCDAGVSKAIVFDPFAGTGTTLEVARALGRSGIGLDLSYHYLYNDARERLLINKIEAWEKGVDGRDTVISDLPLFGG